MSRCAATGARPLALLGLALLGSACSATGLSAARGSATFRCADGRSFLVERDARTATVLFSDMRYQLPRRHSSIGLRYDSGEAALMIDGDFAAFVTETVPDLHDCHQARGAAA
jgi:hypothetical protein